MNITGTLLHNLGELSDKHLNEIIEERASAIAEKVVQKILPSLVKASDLPTLIKKEFETIMADKVYAITDTQLNDLKTASLAGVQSISDAAGAVATEIATIPGLIATAVAAAQAAQTPVDLTDVTTALANIQAGAHNISVTAQTAGAAPPATPVPPVTDPVSGDPVPVTAPVVTVPVSAGDATTTPGSAPPVATGNGGDTTSAPPAAAATASTPATDGTGTVIATA